MNWKNTKVRYWLLPLLGVAVCLYYIQLATCDVVYDDYIRLTNSYLPDVWNPRKFLVADVLTRIPVNYVSRIMNVAFFGFSTMFDTTLGVLSLGISGLLLVFYIRKEKLGTGYLCIIMIVIFSLNKWEMLINGSGWSHFFAFACFYYHYLLLDRMWERRDQIEPLKDSQRLDLKLKLFPFFVTLGVAGPYCAIYSAVLLVAYAFCAVWERRKKGYWVKQYLIYGICVLIPLLLYMWSNSYAVYDHAGAVDQPLFGTLWETPSFFFRFFVKSFASMILGGEVMEQAFSTNTPMFLLGLTVIAGYLLALWLNVRYRLYERTIFPLICLAAGGMNHVLIVLSRWIFLSENYGMSSRYALQFQVGIVGIVLTYGLVLQKTGENGKYSERLAMPVLRLLVGAFCCLLLSGNLYTSYKEFQKAPYRKVYYERRVETALQFEQVDDDTLKQVFDYRKSEAGSGEKVRSALEILKEQKWNVYGKGGLDESSNFGGWIGNPNQ